MENGDLVRCTYKTGGYIGEIISQSPGSKTAVVKILAVTKHPRQGDLHNPNQVDVPLFHERKALSYTEKANIPVTHLKPFEGDPPSYEESLRQAADTYAAELRSNDSDFSKACFSALQRVREEYRV
ncbi:kinase-associated lipoprotein B [Alkalicoccus saliphilus]|jgi:kinase-associated protein B|uniref:Kinase n=1 Tax=Alkalicoccus saliphilus TaxID=200989 RepID=A0A2T4U8D1_9BACI|nr:kinase-associated lipoprotein B [Alkalicoccus saliphilus]PTL39654.1 kinase [Alkalicoccus saliphilus]